MVSVRGEVSPGLRESERTIGVKDFQGHYQYLRVDEDFLVQSGGAFFLPVGVVGESDGYVLVELPHEADSGANRLWVSRDRLLTMEPAHDPVGSRD